MSFKTILLMILWAFPSFILASEHLNHKFQIGINTSTIDVKTENSSNTSKASTSFQSANINPLLNYFFTPKSAVTVSYFKSFFGEFETSSASVGYKYYFSNGTTVVLQQENKKIITIPNWSPFISLAYQLLTVTAESGRIDFDGVEMSLGTDYQLNNLYFLNVRTSYSHLSSGSTRTSSPFSFGVAIGKSF